MAIGQIQVDNVARLSGVYVPIRTAIAPAPSGDATGATDAAALLAAITAATAAGQLLVFGSATYIVNAEVGFTCSCHFAGTTFRAAGGFTGTVGSTPKGTLVSDLVFSGTVIFDANNTAQHAFWIHQATHCAWVNAPIFRNATVEDLTVGDPTDTGFTTGNVIFHPQLTRTVGARSDGSVALHLTTSSTDNEIILMRGSGQETGLWDEGGDNTVSGHYSNSAVQCVRSDASTFRLQDFKPDTPKSVTHSAATGSNGASTITDSRIYPQHQGLPISGTNIPAGTYVGTVVPQTSFTMVDKSGNSVNATGAVSGFTLLPVGLNLQATKATNMYVDNMNAIWGTTNPGDTGVGFAAVVGPGMVYVRFQNPKVWSQDTSNQWNGLVTGLVSGVEWDGLQEVRSLNAQNIIHKTNVVAQFNGIATIGASVATQAVSSGTAFTPNTARDVTMTIPIATSTSGTITVTMGSSTGAESTILSANPVTAGQVLTLRVPQAWKVVITLSSCTLGTVVKTSF